MTDGPADPGASHAGSDASTPHGDRAPAPAPTAHGDRTRAPAPTAHGDRAPAPAPTSPAQLRALTFLGLAWVAFVAGMLALGHHQSASVARARATASPGADLAPFPVPASMPPGPGDPGAAGAAPTAGVAAEAADPDPRCSAPCDRCAAATEGNRVATVSEAGLLCVSDHATGRVLFSLSTAAGGDTGPIAPAFHGEDLFFAAPGGVLYALSVADGSLRWAIGLGERFLAPPTVDVRGVQASFVRGDTRLRVTLSADGGRVVDSELLPP